MEEHRNYIQRLIQKGGPDQNDYSEFDAWVTRLHQLVSQGTISAPELTAIRSMFGAALSPSTMQGFALAKPHGYSGDYEVIDRIYQHYVSPNPQLANWDRYYHLQAAPQAVRNRKTYFHTLLDRHHTRRQPLRVLKIASGPGRSMFEWLSTHPTASVTFQCVEIDPEAILYATTLNRPFLDRIAFTQKNALRYRPAAQFDLVWAAGIFDYFSDAVFLSLLQRLLPAIAPGGELVIGNFCDTNPSRPYMELLGDWSLHHRSAEQLCSLAAQAHIANERISIGSEPQGVNLFLHVFSNATNAT